MPSQYGPVAVNHVTGALEYAASIGTDQIADASIADADISASAAVAEAKLALSIPSPADQGLTGWSYDPALADAAGINLATGYVYLFRVKAAADASVTKVYAYVITAGDTLTAGQNFAGLYSTAGTRLGLTADQAAAWGSTGEKAMTLTGAVAVTKGTFYYVAILSNGTGSPHFMRANVLSSVNAGMAGPWRYQSENTGSKTSLPASSAPAGWQAQTSAIWVAIGV